MVSVALFYPILLISRVAWPLSLIAALLAAVALIGLSHAGIGSPTVPAAAAASVSNHR
jgi:predicted lipoprotein